MLVLLHRKLQSSLMGIVSKKQLQWVTQGKGQKGEGERGGMYGPGSVWRMEKLGRNKELVSTKGRLMLQKVALTTRHPCSVVSDPPSSKTLRKQHRPGGGVVRKPLWCRHLWKDRVFFAYFWQWSQRLQNFHSASCMWAPMGTFWRVLASFLTFAKILQTHNYSNLNEQKVPLMFSNSQWFLLLALKESQLPTPEQS